MMERILSSLGNFSEADLLLFERYAVKKSVSKNEILLNEGEVCQSLFYIISGSLYQLKTSNSFENIIDLYIEDEWIFNHSSLINQSPSNTTIKAFTDAEIIAISLYHLHQLIAQSQAFLQLNKIFTQPTKIHFFDNAFTPSQKYDYLIQTKPQLLQTFPLKMIASYLKITPETLSRVRASH